MHRRPDGAAWDDSTTWTGSDVRDDAGLWHLFYTGTTLAEKSLYQRIGHATSTDLHNRTLADKIVVLKDGLVQQIGSPMDRYHHPENLFVAGFLGSPALNFLDVGVTGVSNGKAAVRNAALDPVAVRVVHPGIVAGGRAKLGLRPQTSGL